MLDVAVQHAAVWPVLDEAGWDDLATDAVRAALAANAIAIDGRTIEVSLRLTDDAEVQQLNRQFRGKDRPTNVLSFPMDDADDAGPGEWMLGDMVLARETCVAEAAEKGISVTDHASHLIVHGTLHLLGHDHLDDTTAEAMEALETKILASLGIANPYRLPDDQPSGG